MSPDSMQIGVALLALTPLAIAGYALMLSGFGRIRGAAFAVFSSLLAVSVAAVAFCLMGASIAGYPGGPALSISLAAKPWDLSGATPFLMRSLPYDDLHSALVLAFELVMVSFAALVPLSAAVDRWRMRSLCISTALTSAFILPLIAHWTWGGGWLHQLGATFGLGDGFLDPAGAGTIQVAAGLCALAIVWVVGPRRGKFTPDGRPAAIPAHNIVHVLTGCVLLLPGWMALNALGSILFAGADVLMLPLIAVNTLLCAAGSFLAAVACTRIRFLKPDASLCANGWVGGLVASSAICCYLSPAGAVAVGIVAGLLVTFSVEWIEVYARTDDASGAVSVHVCAGLWGLLAAGIFPHIVMIADGSRRASLFTGQALAQLTGICALIGVVLPLAYGLNRVLDLIAPQRVDIRDQRTGMDIHELGGVAYPEFMIHPED